VRSGLGTGLALAMGTAVAWLDTRPNWDDAGITAACLLVGAGVAAAAGVRWWLGALVVALPIMLVECRSAGWGIAVALLFTTSGAGVGSGLAILVGEGAGGATGKGKPERMRTEMVCGRTRVELRREGAVPPDDRST